MDACVCVSVLFCPLRVSVLKSLSMSVCDGALVGSFCVLFLLWVLLLARCIDTPSSLVCLVCVCCVGESGVLLLVISCHGSLRVK